MRPHERGASRAVTRPAPVEHPQATVTKSKGVSHSTPKTRVRPVSGSRFAAVALFVGSFVLLVVAFAELMPPVHATHATLAITAGAVLWLTGEAVTR